MKTIMNLTEMTANDGNIVNNDKYLAESITTDDIIAKNYKNTPIPQLKNGVNGYAPKVCYDNPAFIGNNDNKLITSVDNNLMNGCSNGLVINNNNNNINKIIIAERDAKDRTFSQSSNKSIHSIASVLHSDRRNARRVSIVQRKSDDTDPELDINPLRRKMSFIKDTSGEEPLGKAFIQILIASLCAGFGNVGAGVIIHLIQGWTVFSNIKTMFILIPSLLGLKGNLEMTMASRLSTEANLGHMKKWSKTVRMIGGDMALVQCQATVVSFLAAFVAILISYCQTKSCRLDHSLVLIASSVVTANIACLCLGFIMAFVIVFSNKIDIDPDNIATPIAASLGDVSTAGFYALFSQWIYNDSINNDKPFPIAAVVLIVVFIILLPLFYTIARNNSFTHQLVHSGWSPVITAMFISSGGGFFLDSAVNRYDKLPPFQPVICGVGGNLVAVAASKISTRLHMNFLLGTLPFGVRRFTSPISVFWNQRDLSTKLCLLLLSMAIPLHILYCVVIWGIQSDKIRLTVPLVLLYISFATLQVFILLFIGYNLVHILWSYAINPDMSAIPILTALGDLLGSAFLLLAFIILENLNDTNAMKQHLDSVTALVFNSTAFPTNNTF